MNRLIKDFRLRLGTVGEIIRFLLYRKRWWLIPFVIILLAMALLVVFATTTGVGPFIYTLF